MAATLIGRSTWVDDDGTGTTGTLINNAELQLIYDKIDSLFKRTTAGDLSLELENTDTTATSDAGYIARVGSGAAGDAYYQATNGTTIWSWGLDNSVSGDPFVLAASSALGTTNVLSVTTTGIFTLDQGGNDGNIFQAKSSDVAHGMTSLADTDVFYSIKKFSSAFGGATVLGYSAATNGFSFQANVTTVDTTKSAVATGAMVFRSALKSGTGVTTMSANSNLVVFDDNNGARFILDADGDSHQDVGTAWTNFDAHDDLDVLNSLAYRISRSDDPWRDHIRRYFSGALDSMLTRQQMQDMKLVTFNRDGHHFVNMSKLTMLHTGAIRQLGARVRELAEQNIRLLRTVERLERRLN